MIDFIIIAIVYILFLVYFLFFSKKGYRIVDLLLFAEILAPGVFVGGDLINLADFVIPILFFGVILFKKKHFMPSISIPLMIFVLCAIISNITCAIAGYYSISMALKLIRFIEMPLAIYIFYSEYMIKKLDYKIVLTKVFVYSFGLTLLSFVLFFNQSSRFASIQYMWFGGLELHRAGGIYKESSALGFSMVLVAILALYCIKIRFNTIASLVLFILSVIVNILSYTRITNIALIFVIMIMLMKSDMKKKLLILFISAIVAISIYLTVDVVNAFINQRILALFRNSIEDSSSGRFDVWKNAWNSYLTEHRYLFGLGYKLDDFLCDNLYLFAITQTGIVGLGVLLWFVIRLYVEPRKSKGYIRLYKSLLGISFIVVSLTCDCITYTRTMFIFVTLYLLFDTDNKIIPIRVGVLHLLNKKIIQIENKKSEEIKDESLDKGCI